MDESDDSDTDSYTDYYEDEGDDQETFIPYNRRPEWRDIKPCPPEPFEPEILSIAYSPRFRNVHDYFRAIFKLNELSPRALKLTEDCLALNSANFTVWSYRREIILHLKTDLYEELQYVSSMIKSHPKNYQVWQHRKWLIELMNRADDEKSFTRQLFAMDSKNYHAWQHRQWVISHFSLWDGELEYSEKLIDVDVMNNSAWNHRYFVVKGIDKLRDESFISKEVDFVMEKIKLLYDNESSWNYLKGILKGVGLNKFPHIFCTVEKDNCIHSLAFQVDALEEKLKSQEIPDKLLVEKAMDILERLKNEIDTIRSEYWAFMIRYFSSNYVQKIDK